MTEEKGKKGLKGWLGDNKTVILVFIIIIILVLSVLMVWSLQVVPAGHKKVVVSAPNPDWIGKVIDEGWNFNLYYIACSIETVRYNKQTVAFTNLEVEEGLDIHGPVNVRTMDNLEVYVDFSITYHINAEDVGDLRVKYGDYKQTILVQVARSVPRDVASQFNALEMAGP